MWQPIETGPKYLRKVLLFGYDPNTGETKTKGIFIGYCVEEYYYNSTKCFDKWVALGDDGFHFTPTHWMPLPAEPE